MRVPSFEDSTVTALPPCVSTAPTIEPSMTSTAARDPTTSVNGVLSAGAASTVTANGLPTVPRDVTDGRVITGAGERDHRRHAIDRGRRAEAERDTSPIG